MPTTVTISGPQRLVFYELTLNHLSGIGDVWLAVEKGDFDTAARLGREFDENLRLMRDLGWEKGSLEEVDLRMEPEELMVVLGRLRSAAQGLLEGSAEERQAQAEREETDNRCRLAIDTCNSLLLYLEHSRKEGRS
jgi:hypothetical protein